MYTKNVFITPFNIFLSIWFLILFLFQFRIAYFFPEYNISELYYPAISIIFFSIGYSIIKVSKSKKVIKRNRYFSKNKFNIFVYAITVLILVIISINYKLFGMPPFMSLFGYKTIVYLEYGRFKGILFALAIFLFLVSFYATKKISIGMKIISLGILLLYMSRGNIVFSLLSYSFLAINENTISRKKIFVFTLIFVFLILALFQIIGEIRTGNQVFYSSLQIKDEYRIENSGLVWVISYISMPFVNFLELSNHEQLFYGQNILSRSLPAFMGFNAEAVSYYKELLPNQYNTVAGYLAQIYLDFGVSGVIVYNFLLGLLSSYIHRYGNNNLIKSVIMTSLSLIFFVDYFFYFTTIVIVVLSLFFNKSIYIRHKQ